MSVKVVIDAGNAGVRSGGKARVREATRMCFVGCGLAQLGYDVAIAGVPGQLSKSERWDTIRSHCGVYRSGTADVLMSVAEGKSQIGCRVSVGFKTSVSTDNDHAMINGHKLLMAHEYDMAYDRHKALFPIPFMVHEDVIIELEEYGLINEFLRDDLEPIRMKFAAERREPLLSFCGSTWGGRRDFFADNPEWTEVIFYATTKHRLTQKEHLHWLPSCRAHAVLRGDTPKVNIHALCAMLGVPIVYGKIQQRVMPDVSSDNAIVVDGTPDWGELKVQLSDDSLLEKIAEGATQAYLNGWSPLGQAKQLDKKFREMGIVT